MLDNQLKKQAKIRESVLGIIVMLVLCYAVYTNYYVPKKLAVDGLKSQISEVSKNKAGLEKLVQALQKKNAEQKIQMQQQFKKESQDPRVQMLKKYKDPVYGNISEFLNTITQQDFKSAIEITSMKYNMPIKNNGYQETKFILNINGEFTSIIEFIEKLEKIPALVSLDKVNIQVNKKDASKVTLDLDGTFFQLEKENV